MLGDNVTVLSLTSSGNPRIYLVRLDTSLIDRAEYSCATATPCPCARTKKYFID